MLAIWPSSGRPACVPDHAGEPEPCLATYLVNLLFWSSLSIVGPALAAMMQLTEARWSPSVKRVALSTGAFLPISFALFLVLLFLGLGALYPWVNNPALAEKKHQWLNVPFFTVRTALGVLLLYWVAMTFSRAVFAEGAGGNETAATNRRNKLAGIFLILFVVVLSLWGFDLVMSLDPTWYSALLGGYYVVSSLYVGFGLVTFLTIRANARWLTVCRRPPSRTCEAPLRDVRHVALLLLLPYLVIWYGNVPVETRFFLRRFFEDPWRTMAFVIFVAGWLIPFSYLLKRLTGRPPAAHKPLVVILFMGWTAMFLERCLLVFPAVSKVNRFPIGLPELLITAGFFALFVLSRYRFLLRYGARLDQGRDPTWACRRS